MDGPVGPPTPTTRGIVMCYVSGPIGRMFPDAWSISVSVANTRPTIHGFTLGLAPPLPPRFPQLRNAALRQSEPIGRDMCGMAQGQEPSQSAVPISEAGQEDREVNSKCRLIWHRRFGVVPQLLIELVVPPPVDRRIEVVARDAGRSRERLDFEPAFSLGQR